MAVHLFEDLPAVLRKYEKQLVVMVDLVVQKAALAGGDYLASETPVDTGLARSNWVMTLDSPFAGILPPYFPYPTYRLHHNEAVKQLRIGAPKFSKRK